MTDLAGRRTPQKKVQLLDIQRGLPNLSTIGREGSPAMVYSEDSDRRHKKKERARRNLLDTLSAKRPAVVALTRGVTYSYSDRKISSALRQSGPDTSVRKKDLIGLQYDPGAGYKVTRSETDDELDESFEPVCLDVQGRDSGISRSSSLRKSVSNLPQVMHDFNSSLKYTHERNDGSMSSEDEIIYNGEDIMRVLSQNWSKRNKDDKHKPWLKHRPITPTLLEKLDKMKLSSKSRTEQWIKQIPTEKRAYHSPLYRLGNVAKDDTVTSPAVYESWIYEETRKSARGVRKPRQT